MKRILLLAALLTSAPAAALPIIDVSISAGLNYSRADSFLFVPESRSFSGTEPRVTFNASVTSLIGIELGWSKFGSDASTMTIPPPPIVGGQPTVVDVTQSGSALWLAYAPSLRFGPFELTGKLGAARVKQEVAVAGNDFDANETDAFYGVAGTYWFKDTVGLRLDAERVGSDVTQMGLSLTVGF